MDVLAFLNTIRNGPMYQSQIVHVEKIEQRDGQYADLSVPLQPPLQDALKRIGVERLYTHQAEAIQRVREGKNIVIETGTASGKTLCYNLPVLETHLETPEACALYLFPTKALAQDQARMITELTDGHPALQSALNVHSYDGDTPQSQRRHIRETVNLLITNPDMLHIGILPHHSRWSRFFTNLRFVVIDEMHTYRGAFGSHIANVIRRFTRLCRYYGAEPQFVCCSATIANPLELATRLINQPVERIDNDGSPRGERHFVLWNPPHVDAEGRARRSPNIEAQTLMALLVAAECRTITFTRARVTAELIHRYVCDQLRQIDAAYVDRVRAYRGGYLPEDRRQIEELLFSGKLLGVTTTNALELGIDVGGLDACLIVGFPGTIASLWQQAGRAGRRSAAAMVVLIAHNHPIEQYLMRHPQYLFNQSPEHAIIAPENPHILTAHLRCATSELTLTASDTAYFGELTIPLLDELCEAGEVTRVGENYYWGSQEYPAADVDVRVISSHPFHIRELESNRVLGSVDSANALMTVYPGAIYMHEAETYQVERLDMQEQVAYVERTQVNFYTQPRCIEEITITEKQAEKVWPRDSIPQSGDSVKGVIQIGKVLVTRQLTGFTRTQFYTLENMGTIYLTLPEQQLETVALWFTFPASVVDAIDDMEGLKYSDGLEGLKNVLESILPLHAMAERQSSRGKVQPIGSDSSLAIFLYDAYPGGLGYVDKGYQLLDSMMHHAFKLISECDCREGCPSCVCPMHTSAAGGALPDKNTALAILNMVLY